MYEKIFIIFTTFIISLLCIGCNAEEYFDRTYSSQKNVVFNNEINFLDITIVSSYSELREYEILFDDINIDFFDNYVLIVVPFNHSSSERNIYLFDALINHKKMSFVFYIDSPEIYNTDIKTKYFSIGVNRKDIMEVDNLNVFVINNLNRKKGSVHYKKFEHKISII